MRMVRVATAVTVFCLASIASAQSSLETVMPGGIYDPSAPSWKGQAGMTFLQIPASARAAALGNAFSGVEGDPAAAFYNPAGIATGGPAALYVNYTSWFADMTLTDIAATTTVGNFAFGLTYHGIDYGTIKATRISDNIPGSNFEYIGDLNPTAWAVGGIVATQFTDRFKAGAQVKYAYQDFGENNVWTFIGVPRYRKDTADTTQLRIHENRKGVIAFDLGTQYNTGMRGVRINMSLQHFGESKRYVEHNFELPLTYRVGFMFDVIEVATGLPNPDHSLTAFVDGIDRRDVRVDVAAGLEYTLRLPSLGENTAVSLRVGRQAARYQDGWLTFGAGAAINVPGLNQTVQFDWAYADYGKHFSSQFFGFTFAL